MAGRWRTVNDAASQLGTSPDAIRKRVQRETLPSKREDGRVLVWLDGESEAINTDRDELVEELRSRVRYLENESRRKDHLLAAALDRIPAIEPPAATESPQTDTQTPGGVEDQDRGEASQTAPRRPSWWRRFFGFE